ncbi:uncharacterized protein zgc:113229 [Nothobranchius furzeri]|uniref:LOC107376759-like protein n=2 Tax=Nothobranchius furzeri TaxID=105023 RepID=A0A9D3C3Y0_NOTFU|nr:putative LOC107376759-like protein [Nothobranchius furzeri]
MISTQMSQSKDSQALLQSMLQKLKLQSGRDGHMYGPAPVPDAAACTLGLDKLTGAPNLQVVDNNPVNVFGCKNTPSKDLTNPTANSKQQSEPGDKVDGSLTSFSSRKVTTGESRVLGPVAQSGFVPPLPPKTTKNGNFVFFKRADSERGRFSSSALANHAPLHANTALGMSPNQSQVQDFTPTWFPPHSAGEKHKVLHQENEGIGSLRLSDDLQIFSSNQATIRKNQRPSENKTRRWTQRIKERWKDKYRKKDKEDGGTVTQRTEQGAQISASAQKTTAGINTPTNHRDTTIPSWDSCSPNNMTTEDHTNGNNSRYNSDFDIGLGSFSLLDEILKGQEWGKFINPNLAAPSVNKRPSEEPLIRPNVPPKPYTIPSLKSPLRSGSNQWSSSGTKLSLAAASAFPSVHMDVSQPKQQFAHREADQPESMEDGHQSGVRHRASGPALQIRPSSCVENADMLFTAGNRVQTSRKRQHQQVVRRDQRLQTEKMSDGEKAERGRSISAPCPISSQMMDDSVESPHGNVPPMWSLKSPPLSPSPFNPAGPTPRGVLKHSTSQDSEASVETLTKRRRVEENRRVTFSEQVIIIESASLDVDYTDSEDEEDSETDEESLSDQAFEVEQVEAEEVPHIRRSNLPAWIKALKKKNAGKKHW